MDTNNSNYLWKAVNDLKKLKKEMDKEVQEMNWIMLYNNYGYFLSIDLQDCYNTVEYYYDYTISLYNQVEELWDEVCGG